MLQNEAGIKKQSLLSRRQLILGGGLALSSAALGPAFPAAALQDDDTASIRAVTALHVDFRAGSAERFGSASNFSQAVAGGGRHVRPVLTNRFSPILPLTGASVASNRLPGGFEWNTVGAPKTLVQSTSRGITFAAQTSASSPAYFGGIRTRDDVVRPGETVRLAFRADLSGIVGNSAVSICVFLIRIADQRTTVEARAYNLPEDADSLVTLRLKAPDGGDGGYRIVWMVKAGEPRENQRVTVNLRDLVLLSETPSPRIGDRYAFPEYFEKSLDRRDVTLRPNVPAGDYHVIVHTDEFGWGTAAAKIDGPASTLDLQQLMGPAASFSVNQVYVIEKSKWKIGWMNILSPVTRLLPLRFMNLPIAAGGPRPESPNRLSRLLGTPGSLSAQRDDPNRSVPWLTAPQTTWAASLDADRLSHSVFTTTKERYVGDEGINQGYRSEIIPGPIVEFDQDIWLSCSFQIDTEISSSSVVLFQYRYTKNKSGDSSTLAPDLSLEQLSRGRLQLYYRTDRGVPQLQGTSGIRSSFVGPFSFKKGELHSIVLHVRFSSHGGGYLGMWFDGKQYIDEAAAVGYNRDRGPQLRFGSYKYAPDTHRVEFHNMEQGLDSLHSRISHPLAV